MKTKHNKKRNTAVLYEILSREMVKAIVNRDSTKKGKLIQIFRESFGKGSVLGTEVECYNSLVENMGCDKYTAEKIVFRVKERHCALNKQEIFEEQSQVIKSINKHIGPDVYNNFIPNYKSFATIAQIFNTQSNPKQKVIMENQVLETLMGSGAATAQVLPAIDSLVVSSYTKRFNTQYGSLLPEQKDLLAKYTLALGDNEPDFKISLAEELRRLHKAVAGSLISEEIKEDVHMTESTRHVLGHLESLNVDSITSKEMKKVLKIQALVSEYSLHAN